jgi:opacity protein-like surface antigen
MVSKSINQLKRLVRFTLIPGLVLASLLSSSAAFAYLPGFNVGIQLGEGFTNYKSRDFTGIRTAEIKNSGVAGRAYGGYLFNENFGFELGYTAFSKVKFGNINGTLNTTSLSGNVKTYVVDVLGKGIYPFDNGIDIYGKLGLGFAKATSSGFVRDNNTRAQPGIGAGIEYNITPNFLVNLDYLHYQRVGAASNNIESTNLASFGVGYSFG